VGLALITLVLQTTAAPAMAVRGVVPDLLLVLAVGWALVFGRREGLWAGVVAGALQDLAFGQFIGLHLATKGLVAWGAGLVETRVFKENLLVPIGVVFMAAAAGESLVYLALRGLGPVPVLRPVWALTENVLPTALYTAAFSPLAYRIAASVRRHQEQAAAD